MNATSPACLEKKTNLNTGGEACHEAIWKQVFQFVCQVALVLMDNSRDMNWHFLFEWEGTQASRGTRFLKSTAA